MNATAFVDRDEIRASFSRAMSDMYKNEVPLYGTLMELVAEINETAMQRSPAIAASLAQTGELQRLDMERHGAIRVGTAAELKTLGRLFAVMGMEPVGYYDLTPAGVPVHSTAFRAVHEASLQVSPFRVFTSLLRLELIVDSHLRELARSALASRNIFTPGVLSLIKRSEEQGGLSSKDADAFVRESLETFRWQSRATVSMSDYKQLLAQHRLVADVVAFKGPHINHLTPRTLDIDSVQSGMPLKGITPKAVIEGPPRRKHPILLRQTSFKALEERITFIGQAEGEYGSHSARFGEIEQRGAALTPKGRALYDELLNTARDELGEFPNEANTERYQDILARVFTTFPDDLETLRCQGLAFFRYFVTDAGVAARGRLPMDSDLQRLLNEGLVRCEPLVYEDFLPVSAAGIFQSNLGDDAPSHYTSSSNQHEFEKALGRETVDELALYAKTQQRSLRVCSEILGVEGLMTIEA